MIKTILVVDDDKDILTFLKYNLEKEGYIVYTATNGKEALSASKELPDLILLDVMLPDVDGWQVARLLKNNSKTKTIPIMFITAKTSELDEVIGFELGARDYIKKPIALRSLLARIRSVFRIEETEAHRSNSDMEVIHLEGLEINVPNYTVCVDNSDVSLAKKEFELLVHLVQHEGRVLSREALLHSVWGNTVELRGRTVDVHIRKIRAKLGRYASWIKTLRRVGYKFSPNSKSL